VAEHSVMSSQQLAYIDITDEWMGGWINFNKRLRQNIFTKI